MLRNQGVGIIDRATALSYGLTGPCLRGSGVGYDARKDHPYFGYEQYDFDVPVGTRGDAYDRYLVRLEEIRQQRADRDPGHRQDAQGPDPRRRPEFVLPEKTRVLTGMEEKHTM